MIKNLTVEQKNILSSMKVGADFAADVAHACVTMYVWDDNPKFFIHLPPVAAPHAVFGRAA